MANGAVFAIVHNRCEKKYDPKLAGVPRCISADEVKRRGLPIVNEGEGETLTDVKKAKYVASNLTFEKTAVQERLSSLTSRMHVCEIEVDDADALAVLGARLADEKDPMGKPGGENQFRRSLVLSEDFEMGVFQPEGRVGRPCPQITRDRSRIARRAAARARTARDAPRGLGASRPRGRAGRRAGANERASERGLVPRERARAETIMLTSY